MVIGISVAPTATHTQHDDKLYFPPVLVLPAGAGGPAIDVMEVTITRDVYGQVGNALLPMVFFDHPGDPAIPERFVTFGSSSEADWFSDTGDMYDGQWWGQHKQILNIVGSKLARLADLHARNRSGKSSMNALLPCIELEGGYSAEPGESPEVAMMRAEEVRNYVARIWQVDTALIGIRPPRRLCGSSDNQMIQEESRRVTIYSDFPGMLAPTNQSHVQLNGGIHLKGWIDPKVSIGAIDSVELILYRGATTLARCMVPATANDPLYRFSGFWSLYHRIAFDALNTRRESGLSIQGLVHLTNGETRPTNIIRIRGKLERGRDGSTHVMPDTVCYCRISYYEPMVSVPGTMQLEHLRHCADSIAARMAKYPGRRWVITFDGLGGDASEHPALDPAIASVKLKALRIYELYMHRASDTNVGRGTLSLIDGGGNTIFTMGWLTSAESIPGAVGNDVRDYWYHREPLDERSVATLDSLWMQRMGYTAAYLFDRLKRAGIDSFRVRLPDRVNYVGSEPPGSGSTESKPSLGYFPLPETRYQNRTVAVVARMVGD